MGLISILYWHWFCIFISHKVSPFNWTIWMVLAWLPLVWHKSCQACSTFLSNSGWMSVVFYQANMVMAKDTEKQPQRTHWKPICIWQFYSSPWRSLASIYFLSRTLYLHLMYWFLWQISMKKIVKKKKISPAFSCKIISPLLRKLVFKALFHCDTERSHKPGVGCRLEWTDGSTQTLYQPCFLPWKFDTSTVFLSIQTLIS